MAPIVVVVAAYYRVLPEQIYGRGRTTTVERARAASVWLVRAIYKYSFPEIGKAFDRDHTTILRTCRSVDERMGSDAKYKELIDRLHKEALNKPAAVSVFRNGDQRFPAAVWAELKRIKSSGMLGESIEEVIMNIVSMKVYEMGRTREE